VIIKAAVLTLSDKGAKGLRADESGPALREGLEAIGAEVLFYEIIPDEKSILKEKLIELSMKTDLIITTGGTGLSPRDITPEATLEVTDRAVPGIAEAVRSYGLARTNRAMLSRGVAGLRGKCLIINLPGSPKGAKEGLEAIAGALPHAVEKLRGGTEDCAR
jgi:molybdenum cofactor synthesis domain-containing protein